MTERRTQGCPYCGACEEVELAEIYPEMREFDLSFCCDEAQAEWLESFDHVGRKEWTSLFRSGAGLDVRQIVPGLDGRLRIDWGLHVEGINRKEAYAHISRHHRHNGAPQGDIFRLAARNGPDLIAVVTVGRPVARENERIGPNGTHLVLEVTRLCVRDDHPVPALKWNACSQLYSAAARVAREKGAERVITYTLITESGQSLLSCGWVPLYETPKRKQGWSTPSRPRDPSLTPNGEKVCWEKRLVPGLSDLNRRAALWRLKGWTPRFGAEATNRQPNLFAGATSRAEFHIDSTCPHCVSYSGIPDLCRSCGHPLCPACVAAIRSGNFLCHVKGASDSTVESVASEIIRLRTTLGNGRGVVTREIVGERYGAVERAQGTLPLDLLSPRATGGAQASR